MTRKTKKKLKTGCLSKTRVTLKTKDKHKIYVGQRLFYWTEIPDRIISFKVGAWHNGKSSQLLEYHDGDVYFVNISGYGGTGVYPDYEDNVFDFYLTRYLYASLDSLLANRTKLIQKKLLVKPEVTWKD